MRNFLTGFCRVEGAASGERLNRRGVISRPYCTGPSICLVIGRELAAAHQAADGGPITSAIVLLPGSTRRTTFPAIPK